MIILKLNGYKKEEKQELLELLEKAKSELSDKRCSWDCNSCRFKWLCGDLNSATSELHKQLGK